MSLKSKDAKNVKEYNITSYNKGFMSTNTIDGITTNEFFQYKEIYQVIHHLNRGVEIVGYNGKRRVFYNDLSGESQTLFNTITSKMVSWMGSNLN